MAGEDRGTWGIGITGSRSSRWYPFRLRECAIHLFQTSFLCVFGLWSYVFPLVCFSPEPLHYIHIIG